MNTELHMSVKWALRAAAVAGLLLSLTTLPIAWAVVSGHASSAVLYQDFLPQWLWWGSWSVRGVDVLVTGALCALILASGPWPARALAVAVSAWTVYMKVGFARGGYWYAWGARGNYLPSAVAVTVTGVLLVAVSVVALVVASRLDVPTERGLNGPANKPLQTDAAPRRG